MNSQRFIKENEISDLIKKDNDCSSHFQWTQTYKNLTLDLVTFNPKHNNYFLLHSITKQNLNNNSNVYILILDEMIKYIKEYKNLTLNYTIIWNYKQTNEPSKTSYFSGKNIKEVMQKFYYQKEDNSIIVYNINIISES
tara:strand:- start:64 stop:480 length:417 start_codon:yes stop_codon:yes gene_type:complete